MSNIFITDIVGTNDYAVPTDDTELATATSGLDTLLSGVANLAYDRVLAWVEDSGGPGGAEGDRSLNCLVEKFTYLSNECPSESQVDTMTAAIESALEADSDITSVGNQQVHIFQAGAYFLWNRDASGGFLYPNTATDDVAVGPFSSPTGKWFDDGDMVLGAAAMSGTEKLRVVGSARIDTNGQLLIADSATIPPLNITERSAAPSAPSAGDIYLDDGTNTGSTSPGWRRYTGATWEDMGALASSGVSQWNEQNIVHVAKSGNDSNNGDAINLAKLTVGSAITRATALSPSATNRITILIHPGFYDEVISSADSYVDFVGIDRDACVLRHTSSGGTTLSIVDSNVRVANLTVSRASGSSSGTFRISSNATGVKVEYVRVSIEGGFNDRVNLSGANEAVFRDCIIENVTSDNNQVLSTSLGGTYRFFDCTFNGQLSLGTEEFFYNCHMEADGTSYVIDVAGVSGQVFRMFGTSVRRSGAVNNGHGVRIGGASTDWGIIGCDIDAAQGSGNYDIHASGGAEGVSKGNIVETGISPSTVLKSTAHRFVSASGGVDTYDTIQKAIDSLPNEGGVVELTDDITETGNIQPDSGSTGKVILEGNGFTISGSGSWFDAQANTVFEIRNAVFSDKGARLYNSNSVIKLKNVQIEGGGYILVDSVAQSTSKYIIDNVDVDGSSLGSNEQPIRSNTSNAAEVHVNDSSFTGRNVAGSAGAAVYFSAAGAVFRATYSLFIHPQGTGTDYEIDASTAVTVYTQYCMTRANAIGAAASITEGITGTNNIVDSNAGFLWRE